MPSKLSGTRTRNSIDLAVRWGRETNGDRSAKMTIEKVGGNRVRLRTTDRDLKTGTDVVTSDIRLTRYHYARKRRLHSAEFFPEAQRHIERAVPCRDICIRHRCQLDVQVKLSMVLIPPRSSQK